MTRKRKAQAAQDISERLLLVLSLALLFRAWRTHRMIEDYQRLLARVNASGS